MDDDLALALALSASEAKADQIELPTSLSHPDGDGDYDYDYDYDGDGDGEGDACDGLEGAEAKAEADAEELEALMTSIDGKMKGGGEKRKGRKVGSSGAGKRAKKAPLKSGFEGKIDPRMVDAIKLEEPGLGLGEVGSVELQRVVEEEEEREGKKKRAERKGKDGGKGKSSDSENDDDGDDGEEEEESAAGMMLREALILMATTSQLRSDWEERYKGKGRGKKKRRRGRMDILREMERLLKDMGHIVERKIHRSDPVESTKLLRILRGAVLQKLMSQMSQFELRGVDEAPISNTAFEEFLGNLNVRGESVRFAWHGTPEKNIRGIMNAGLIIGGTRGIGVRCGRVLGAGVYLGAQAQTSMAYTTSDQEGVYTLLACAVIPSSHVTSHRGNTVFVARRPALVLPVYIIRMVPIAGNYSAVSVPRPKETTIPFFPRNRGTEFFPPLAALAKAKAVKARQKDARVTRERNAARQEYYIHAPPCPPTPSPLYQPPTALPIYSPTFSPTGVSYSSGPAFPYQQ